ncbi:MAG: winged helix-turn-helix transcriptional regulator [Paludibacterium sp.]|uniref:winged helix-turn-helix transcriptional regulator n=1 Tax=Paludibacterium sp. TaxID=1917523 RepID=UPI0025D52B0C|nr:winged helix-turn-helix transcriptional regulator [Paludibacterium sp.]MBV8048507.1 winged helix-turn-helix transcriptional regulator [Paludibacterium sp.]MBV8647367.1 winged helix-turn-helix transcriptional regulator [Paludibacterium sp.]
MRKKTTAERIFDKIDLRILQLLQNNGRISLTDLAEKVGLSTTPCTERVRRLEREGVIEGYFARLNPHMLNASLLVFVEIKLSAKSGDIFDAFRREVQNIPEILECHLVSGEFDYLIKARIPDMSMYRELLGNILLKLPAANESRSYVVMEEIKETLSLAVQD